MRLASAAVVLVAIAGCGGDSVDGTIPIVPEVIRLESPAFEDGGELPTRFTCDGKGLSPPLRWSEVPPRARDLALLAQDLDAPGGTFVHWTLWKLPFAEGGQGRVLEGNVAPEMDEGENDFGDRGWGPPCPPEGDGPHRYVFTLLALDRLIDLGDGAAADDVRAAIAAGASGTGGQLETTYGR